MIAGRGSLFMKRAMHIAMMITAALLLSAAAASAYALYKIDCLPANFVGRVKEPPKGRRVLVCIGDSNTQGSESSSYVDTLVQSLSSSNIEVINAGVNGDLAYNVLMRLDEVIRLDPAYVTILIGTNDANAALAVSNERRYIRIKRLPRKPDLAWFSQNLRHIIKRLRTETGAEIALLSIPVIGEDTESSPYKMSERYSREIMEIASQTGVQYLPLNEFQGEYIRSTNHTPGMQYNPSVLIFFEAALRRYLLMQSWDKISEKKGLKLTVETIHLNGRGAKMTAELIENWIYSKLRRN